MLRFEKAKMVAEPKPLIKTLMRRSTLIEKVDRSVIWPEMPVVDCTLPGIPANLAADEALLIRAEEEGGPGFLRFWEADEVAVILGASGRIAAEVNVKTCRIDGVMIARRASGGGTVVIGPGALNITVVLPIATDPAFASVDIAQRALLGEIASTLCPIGVDVRVQGSGDLTIGSRKFSGSAQRRLRHMLMVHATILYNFPLDLIDRYLPMPPRRPDYRDNRSHADFLTNIPLTRDAILKAICGLGSSTQVLASPHEASIPMDEVGRLVGEKYSDRRWIERL